MGPRSSCAPVARLCGYGLTFPSPWVIDILGKLALTTSSSTVSTGPSNLERLEDQWRAAERYHLTTFARVPDIGSSTILRYLDRVCALLEDVAVPENLDAILAVPGVDLYSIRPNDFAQSLGYPGQLDHPEVVKATQEITRRIHQAGRRMQAEVTKSAGSGHAA